MNSEGYTYLIYDKFCTNHNFNNPETISYSLQDIFDNDIFTENNSIELDKSIPKDLNKEVYIVNIYENMKSEKLTYIIIVAVNNNELFKHTDIPNIDFLIEACKYHIMYEKARLNTKKKEIILSDNEKIETEIHEIVKFAENNLGDITDPIIENPTFLNCTLYNYQKRSIKWMLDKEKSNKTIYYNLNEEINFGAYMYDVIQQKFTKRKSSEYTNDTDNHTFIQKTESDYIKITGGALIDEVGLGKTIQMTTLSLLNPAKNINYYQNKPYLTSRATLVICPSQLCGQWKREIEKMINKPTKTLILLTKVHFYKLTYQDVLDADFVIVSTAFLENTCFVSQITEGLEAKYRKKSYLRDSNMRIGILSDNLMYLIKKTCENPLSIFLTRPNILGIHWNRILIDEFHELFTVDKYKHVANLLPLFKSTYKWIITGTPFNSKPSGIIDMLNFVTNYKQTYKQKIVNIPVISNYLKQDFFRKNTKKSINSEYSLLPLKETVLWLKFSKTERMMYNAYLANPNNDKHDVFLRKLCCHPKLAEELQSSLSNCKTLEDIQRTMINHYKTNADEANSKLQLIIKKRDNYKNWIRYYEIKRQKRLLKRMGFSVIIEYFPVINKEILKQTEQEGEPINDYDSEDSDDESTDDEEKIRKYPKDKIVFIKKDNFEEINQKIGKLWNEKRKTLDNMLLRLQSYEKSVELSMKEHNGKLTTYNFYNNLMDRIKKTFEKEKHDSDSSDSDSDSSYSDSEEDENEEKCGVCLGSIPEENIGITKCGHMFCYECIKMIVNQKHQCPYCKNNLSDKEIFLISYEKEKSDDNEEIRDKNKLINLIGTKLANLIFFLKSTPNHTIIFSQWDDLLKRVGLVLNEYGIKNVFCKGNTWQRDKAIREFNADDKIKVIMLSSDSAASGSNLTKATQVILLDPVYGDYEFRRNTEWQSIGRAHRMGQTKQVEVIRFIIKDTIEDEIYKLNIEEDKKYKENIKIFELTEDNIKLSDDKIKELDESKKLKKKIIRTVPRKPVIESSDSESSDDESTGSEIEAIPPVRHIHVVQPVVESSDESSDSEDEVKPPPEPIREMPVKQAIDDSSDSEDEDKPIVIPPHRLPCFREIQKNIEAVPVQPAVPKKRLTKKIIEPVVVVKKTLTKKKLYESSSDESSSDGSDN